MSISCYDIQQALGPLITNIIGDSNTIVSQVCPAESALKNSVVFVHQEKYLDFAIQGDASAIVTTQALADRLNGISHSKTILISPNIYLSMALTLQKFFPEKDPVTPGIHPTALVAPTAIVSKSAYIGPYCTIGENARIGDHVKLEGHVSVDKNVSIGDGTHIFSHVTLGPRTQIGKNCEIKANTVIGGEGFGFAHDQKGHHHRIPQKGRVVLEDNVYIGSMCAVDRATLENGETRIGEGTKLDNHIQIAHNVKIGKHCVFAGGTVIAGSTTIGNHCVVGGHSSIAGHIKICDQVHLGGRSAVSGSIKKPGAYTGHPLQPLKDHLRSEAYIKRLPALGKAVQILLKKIGLEDSI